MNRNIKKLIALSTLAAFCVVSIEGVALAQNTKQNAAIGKGHTAEASTTTGRQDGQLHRLDTFDDPTENYGNPPRV